jgi:hypothetical protein
MNLSSTKYADENNAFEKRLYSSGVNYVLILFYFLYNLLNILIVSAGEFKSVGQENTACFCRLELTRLLMDRLLQSITYMRCRMFHVNGTTVNIQPSVSANRSLRDG